MEQQIIKLMKEQHLHVNSLLMFLEIQCKMIMEKDVFGLESIVDKIGNESKVIAQLEVERRKIIKDQSLVQLVNSSNNNELKKSYDALMKVLQDAVEKKNTNELLLKQQLIFTNKMLNIINPDKEAKTYNSYGNLSK